MSKIGATRRDKLKALQKCVDAGMERLDLTWADMGLSEEQRCDRTDVVFEHVQRLLAEMNDEEDNLKTRLQERIDSYQAEIDIVFAELGLQPDLPNDDNLTLVSWETTLRKRLDALDREKTARLRSLNQLREQEEEFVHTLGMEEFGGRPDSPAGVPSLEFLKTLQERVESLESEKRERLLSYENIQESVAYLMKELEKDPQNEFEESLLSHNPDSFLLSRENIEKASGLHQELQREFDSLEMTASSVREQVESMWNRLNVPREERETFAQEFPGCKPAVIKRWTLQLAFLEEQKRKHMKEFVMSVKQELEKWQRLCHFGSEQMRALTPEVPNDDFSEDVLEVFEREVESLKSFYEENTHIFQKINKRRAKWERFVALENKSNDPSRFDTRGGKLQKELNEAKKLQKELPKIETELETIIRAWESERDEFFVVNDVPYLDSIAMDWNELNLYKEQERLARLKNKESQMEKTLSCKTPVKRKGMMTPASSSQPKRVRLLQSTPASGSRYTHSSLRSPKVTPRPRLTPRVTGVVTRSAAAKTPKKEASTAPVRRRRILGALNETAEPLKPSDISLASTVSYGAFSDGISKKEKICRSSEIPSANDEN